MLPLRKQRVKVILEVGLELQELKYGTQLWTKIGLLADAF